jgi:hypothetical protein
MVATRILNTAILVRFGRHEAFDLKRTRKKTSASGIDDR